jgi:energy-coupling factor transport system ATP-binding protein
MDEIIKTENLSFIYQKGTPFEFYALRDVSISIKKGELAGIIGPTGSGKSTLIQHFNGLLTPTSGKILVAGKDLSRGNPKNPEIRTENNLYALKWDLFFSILNTSFSKKPSMMI